MKKSNELSTFGFGINEPDEKSLSLSDAIESLVPPVLEKLKLKTSIETPKGHNAFIHALLDQLQFDDEYSESNITVENVRESEFAKITVSGNILGSNSEISNV